MLGIWGIIILWPSRPRSINKFSKIYRQILARLTCCTRNLPAKNALSERKFARFRQLRPRKDWVRVYDLYTEKRRQQMNHKYRIFAFTRRIKVSYDKQRIFLKKKIFPEIFERQNVRWRLRLFLQNDSKCLSLMMCRRFQLRMECVHSLNFWSQLVTRISRKIRKKCNFVAKKCFSQNVFCMVC